MLRIRAEQMSTMRRKRIGDTLIAQLAPFVSARWDAPNQHLLLEDASGARGSLSFDGSGFLAGYTSPLGRCWTLGNDSDGRLLSFASPSGHVLTMTYTPEGLLGSFASTTQARIDLAYAQRFYVASVYSDGTAEQIAYAPEGDPVLFQDRRGDQIRCTYDRHRRMTALADGNGQVTRFRYSDLNRPIEVLHPNGQRDSYEFAGDGTLAGAAQGEGARAEVTSDARGRPLALRYNDGTEATFAYTEDGLLTAASSPAGAHSFSYDDKGLFVAEEAGPYRHTHRYDLAGRLISTTSLGNEVQLRWDADSRLIGITDWNGGEHTLEYLAADRGHVQTSPAHGGGVGVRCFVRTDTAGRLSDLQVVAHGESRYSLRCSYDIEGRLESLADSAFGARGYSYDANSRVVFASSAQAEEAFAYDRAANLAAVNGARRIYDGANQLLEDGETALRWDDRGNLTAYSTPDGEVRLRYNARNQLVAFLAADGTETTYAYDPLGRRIQKRTGDVETRFFWAGEQMTCEIRADMRTGALRRQDFFYHPETGAPLLTAVDGEVYGIHTDHLGTPRAITAADGEVVWLADYAAFGEARLGLERVTMPLRLRGQYHDVESGLHYNRFRYYAPRWGRYISRDPLTYLAGTNHYLYAGANPLNELDATGLIGWKGIAALAAGAAVGIAVGIVLAPIAVPLAILAGGIAAGAVGAGLNEALNEKQFSLTCIAKAAGLGALAGAAATLPFLALPATAGIVAFAGAGALGGALSYGVNCLDGVEKNPSVKGLLTSMALGGVTAGALKGVGDALFASPEGGAGDVAPETASESPSSEGTAPESVSPSEDTVPEAAAQEPEGGPSETPPREAAESDAATEPDAGQPENASTTKVESADPPPPPPAGDVSYAPEYLKSVADFQGTDTSSVEDFYANMNDQGIDYQTTVQNAIDKYDMTPDEAHAVFGYTTKLFYRDLNTTLGSGGSPEADSLTNLITSGMSKMPDSGPIQYRGWRLGDASQMADFDNQFQVGNTVRSNFWSTAPNQADAYAADRNAIINTSSAKDISDLSFGTHFHSIIGKPVYSSETLIPPGTQFQVTGTDSAGNILLDQVP